MMNINILLLLACSGFSAEALDRGALQKKDTWTLSVPSVSYELAQTAVAEFEPPPQDGCTFETAAELWSDSGSKLEDPRPLSRWAIGVGAAFITRNVIEEVLSFRIRPARGDAAGWIYSLNLTYTWREFDWKIRDRTFRPQLEAPLTLLIADERGSNPFLGYNAGIGLRWTDFPWNRYVSTTAATGFGISYSEKVFEIDRVRHPGRRRSHWKFYWPLQITMALPCFPQHQLMLFNHHQSGGRVFDRGGMNAVGFGYRYVFPSRR
jgi:hypothetical protein